MADPRTGQQAQRNCYTPNNPPHPQIPELHPLPAELETRYLIPTYPESNNPPDGNPANQVDRITTKHPAFTPKHRENQHISRSTRSIFSGKTTKGGYKEAKAPARWNRDRRGPTRARLPERYMLRQHGVKPMDCVRKCCDCNGLGVMHNLVRCRFTALFTAHRHCQTRPSRNRSESARLSPSAWDM